jgi:glycosyltransferase involved in cell wall biosynthesis
MRSFDIFVLPSKAEGISNTILEAMATGLPIIATRVGGNPELVVDKETGLLVEKENVTEMAAALQDLVVDDDKRTQFASAALQRAQQEFSIDNMVARYLAVYDRH